jgi:hypothetical protein
MPGVNILKNTESEPDAQSLQCQAHPRTPCASACLKLLSKLFCVEAKKSLWSGYLAGFRLRARTFICLHET